MEAHLQTLFSYFATRGATLPTRTVEISDPGFKNGF